MTISLNEIRDRAIAFAAEWRSETSENAEAKTFWDQFFNVFGMSRRRLASFEQPVKKSDGQGGFIDLLWRGTLLVEHKSAGKDLDRAKGQALSYFSGLSDRDLPRFVIVTDFARMRLYDLGKDHEEEFEISELPKKIDLFGFISGYEKISIGVEDEANIKAAHRLGALHDLLKSNGYDGHHLEVLMVRILFCLFADDTLLFEKGAFREYIEQRTSEDGTDLGPRLQRLFEILDMPPEKRQKTLDEQLAAFPYVNGSLFGERLPFPDFNKKMRDALLVAAGLDWSKISPAIFGSLFQSIMNGKERRAKGAHYTSEANILKVIRPLFIDDLRADFERNKRSPSKLKDLQETLSKIKVLDPACGCGNFLVIAYRELRLLELEIVHELQKVSKNRTIDLKLLFKVDVDQFYGIEIDEWPSRIAEVAMWMMDHQMNIKAAEEFGLYFARIPLRKSPVIVQRNALDFDWSTAIDPRDLNYIIGNPPFVGSKVMKPNHKADVARVLGGIKNSGVLDYVACWYFKSAEIMAQNPNVRAALVSTNSITQGEQVAAMWPPLLSNGVQINFAHRTFQWSSEASGAATVQCVIIGFSLKDVGPKTIYQYSEARGTPHAIRANNINPYLIDHPNTIVFGQGSSVNAPRRLYNGNIAADEGNLLLTEDEKNAMIADDDRVAKYIRDFVGAEDLIDGTRRHCLWLVNCPPTDLATMPLVQERLKKVRIFREKSPKLATRQKGKIPSLFTEIRQPSSGTYLAVPRTSSENRSYLPIGILDASVIAANDLQIVPGGGAYEFGVLSSAMHMAWMRLTSGRLESRYRYSAKFTYNTFVWPSPTQSQKEAVEKAASKVLEERAAHPKATLGILYDPTTMPPGLAKAHTELDRAVDASYGRKFTTEMERVLFLFGRYQAMVTPLIPRTPSRRRPRRNALT